ncbi:MerR family transcriptional regulator [bacterium]|jgi:DNA-binding transcriptional MerR regulator|nr:MerR family transcriptional regulator [bacterium]
MDLEPHIQFSQIPDKLFFRIGDVADLAGVKPHVLRYWETEFPMISPTKSNTGQRVYKRTDVESILLIKHLLYRERYSIEGARRRMREMRRSGEIRKMRQDPQDEQPSVEKNSQTSIEALVNQEEVLETQPMLNLDTPIDDPIQPLVDQTFELSRYSRQSTEEIQKIHSAAKELQGLLDAGKIFQW